MWVAEGSLVAHRSRRRSPSYDGQAIGVSPVVAGGRGAGVCE